MDDERMAELQENFDHFDQDENGKIDFAEFIRLMDDLQIDFRSNQGYSQGHASRARRRHTMHKRIVNEGVIENPRFSLSFPR